MSAFRLNASGLYMTWPRNDTTKEQVLEGAKTCFGDLLVKYVIAEEEHKNGEPHLHAWFKLSKKVDIRGFEELDKIAGKHGDYQGARCDKDVIKYCAKESDYIANFDVESEIKARKGKHSIMGTALIKNKRNIQEMLEEMPEMSIHAKAYKFAQDLVHPNLHARTKKPTVHVICGPPGSGKTTAALNWSKTEEIFFKVDPKWWDGYANQPIVVFDEFDKKPMMDHRELLQLLSPVPYRVNNKGGSTHFNSHTVILIGVNHPSNWYEDDWIWKQFRRRINTITELDEAPEQVEEPVEYKGLGWRKDDSKEE